MKTKSTCSLPWGCWEYALWIVGFGTTLLLGGWFFRIPSTEALEDTAALMLAICAIAALVWALRAQWRLAVLTIAVPLSFAAAAFAAEAPFEVQILGMTGEAAQLGLPALALLTIALSALVTVGASDAPPYGEHAERGRASSLRAAMLLVFFAAPPVSAAYALYFARAYSLIHEYLPMAFYVETACIILIGLAVACLAGLLAERSAVISAWVQAWSWPISGRAHALSHRLESYRIQRHSHHHHA